MFEDIDDHKNVAVSVTRDSSDRVIAYALWARNAQLGLASADAWRVLAERYPEDARFALLGAYEELVSAQRSGWTPSAFLVELRRILDAAGGRLNPEARDLLALAEDDLHPLSDEDAARLERTRTRISMTRRTDVDGARKRLHRLGLDVVRELHERTSGGKSLGRTSASLKAAAPASDWKTALEKATGKRVPYAPTARVTAGDVIEHPKFGPGVVLAVEQARANILFESGARKLMVA